MMENINFDLTAEEYIIAKGFATWSVDESPTTQEVVINYQDCLQAMKEYADMKLENERINQSWLDAGEDI